MSTSISYRQLCIHALIMSCWRAWRRIGVSAWSIHLIVCRCLSIWAVYGVHHITCFEEYRELGIHLALTACFIAVVGVYSWTDVYYSCIRCIFVLHGFDE